jgi:hypothetical protein
MVVGGGNESSTLLLTIIVDLSLFLNFSFTLYIPMQYSEMLRKVWELGNLV